MSNEAFTGRVVVVTGGAASLGRGICENVAARVATVVIADLDGTSARRVESEITASGGRALALEIDITQPPAVDRMVSTVIERYGRIDGLVNNAGIVGPVTPLWETTDDVVERVFDVNVRAAFSCTRAVVRHMMNRHGGSIVTISSVAAKDGPKNHSVYSSSKAAVICFTKSWAKELASYGVRVNCVSPSLIDNTGMQSELSESFIRDSVSRIPMGRPARVDEVANVVSFLLSDEASFVTATCYDVSGGRATY
jgi:NAD(P)-dependent dehydrogenase (short-subunit alcohol dehydrogenase family)